MHTHTHTHAHTHTHTHARTHTHTHTHIHTHTHTHTGSHTHTQGMALSHNRCGMASNVFMFIVLYFIAGVLLDVMPSRFVPESIGSIQICMTLLGTFFNNFTLTLATTTAFDSVFESIYTCPGHSPRYVFNSHTYTRISGMKYVYS